MSSDTLVKKILILAANPNGTSRLRLDEEVREIDAGLRRARKRDEFLLEQRWAVRSRDVQRAMLDIQPQIVHFSGHGAGDEGLAFEDETGQVKFVDAEALAGLFELFKDQLECVVLNACYSEVQANAITRHINYVIGMNRPIGDKAAIEFAVGFYDALGAGRAVEFAHKFGCAAIRLAGIPEQLTPILKKKKPNTNISEIAANVPLPQEQPLVNNQPTTGSSTKAIEVFFSYAHKDEDLRDELNAEQRVDYNRPSTLKPQPIQRDTNTSSDKDIRNTSKPNRRNSWSVIGGGVVTILALIVGIYIVPKLQIKDSPQSTNSPASSSTLQSKDSPKIEQQKNPKPEALSDNLPSVRGGEYTRLEALLAARNWKEADQETLAVMHTLWDRSQEPTFLCQDLSKINQLWVRASNGRFGFSVQKHIQKEVKDNYQAFGERVGWDENSESWNWVESPIFSQGAPIGHLPTFAHRTSSQVQFFEFWNSLFSCPGL